MSTPDWLGGTGFSPADETDAFASLAKQRSERRSPQPRDNPMSTTKNVPQVVFSQPAVPASAAVPPLCLDSLSLYNTSGMPPLTAPSRLSSNNNTNNNTATNISPSLHPQAVPLSPITVAHHAPAFASPVYPPHASVTPCNSAASLGFSSPSNTPAPSLSSSFQDPSSQPGGERAQVRPPSITALDFGALSLAHTEDAHAAASSSAVDLGSSPADDLFSQPLSSVHRSPSSNSLTGSEPPRFVASPARFAPPSRQTQSMPDGLSATRSANRSPSPTNIDDRDDKSPRKKSGSQIRRRGQASMQRAHSTPDTSLAQPVSGHAVPSLSPRHRDPPREPPSPGTVAESTSIGSFVSSLVSAFVAPLEDEVGNAESYEAFSGASAGKTMEQLTSPRQKTTPRGYSWFYDVLMVPKPSSKEGLPVSVALNERGLRVLHASTEKEIWNVNMFHVRSYTSIAAAQCVLLDICDVKNSFKHQLVLRTEEFAAMRNTLMFYINRVAQYLERRKNQKEELERKQKKSGSKTERSLSSTDTDKSSTRRSGSAIGQRAVSKPLLEF
mmetsp:Transcript_7499/g.23107  ORF Transcript_7499/g.23107 Transcript_7499/m.23107 type:complete len:554 (-) Transcript_7499:45-1706(-)|eukprot:CAMPEP_0177661682 /NCGR_PEP_ID=MMETSP0447-20121125/18838_1 /TAXON_ID=0 /ORGANISM="Stygamoeba regulata, Strain BSH-02190019" /LENGTH=553 /DNA_ID=CAMNT_0019167099 /DNA_START=101 /DNA_END=1762 /DNA_ORIENTATION=-